MLGRPSLSPANSDIRDRRERLDVDREGTRRSLSRDHRGGTLPPAAEALFQEGRPPLSGREVASGLVHFRAPEPDCRSAVFPYGSHQLPERSDLHGAHVTETRVAHIPLRAEPTRLPGAGVGGDGRRVDRSVRSDRSRAQDLLQEAGDEQAAFSPSLRRPSPDADSSVQSECARTFAFGFSPGSGSRHLGPVRPARRLGE